MFARAEQCGGHREAVGALQRLDRRAGRDPAVERDLDRVVGGKRGRLGRSGQRGNGGGRPGSGGGRRRVGFGDLSISKARARLGRRRMKPRSSSAEISR